ncbi:S9 family peptidase [Sphingomicrobium sp. XHP0239]|uniref:S9 family peptidase n=1 Tax=Sphingomicrobium maritimum TaxID=3133972 RepID=UPI0031CC999D
MKTTLALAALATALFPAAIADARPMTPEDLVRIPRVGSPTVLPNGKVALVPISYAKDDLSGRETRQAILNLDNGNLTFGTPDGDAFSIPGARIGGDGNVYYVSDDDGSAQLYRVVPGERPAVVSGFSGGEIDDYVLSPNGEYVVFLATRDLDCTDFACGNVEARDEGGNALEFNEIFVRQWDSWVDPGVKAQLYGYRIKDGRLVGNGVVLGRGLTGNTPSRPFGGSEEISVANDGMVYFAQRAGGSAEPTSTNLDIYAASIDGTVDRRNLTDDNEAYDSLPTVSPDGRMLAYVAMERPGYESDKLSLMVRDLASGRTRNLSEGWDVSVGSIAWSPDGRSLYVTTGEVMEHPLTMIDVASGRRTRLVEEGNVGSVVPLANGRVLYSMNSITSPTELYLYDPASRSSRQLTNVTGPAMGEIDPVTFDKFSFEGAEGDTVWGFRLKPADRVGDLPVAFVVHGGPQGSFGNSWSTRWNPRMISAPGYGVVSIDFHGSTGYGQDFTDSINQDWGGKPLEDLQLGLAHALQMDEQLDGDRICALGASYGGFMMNWIAGNWSHRFDCLVNHAGLFDTRSFYYVTEELWFPRWDFGGSYAEQSEVYERWNPVNHVDDWQTPMLVIHGLKDYRVPYGQGLGAFTALQERDIPSKLLIFPDENHWILDGENWIRWQSEVHEWMAHWTAPEIDRSLDMME